MTMGEMYKRLKRYIYGIADSSSTISNKDGNLLERTEYIMSLLGLLTDDELIDTVLGRLYTSLRHNHSPQKVYPTLANGITFTGGAGAWQLGNKIEIVPVNTITSPFDIHWMNFGIASANDTYELVLYKGTVGNEIEIGRCRTARISNQSGTAPVQMMTEIIPANTRISGAVASSSGGGDTIVGSIFYHNY